MIRKKLSALLAGLDNLGGAIVTGGDPWVTGLVYDSRSASPGSLFFALDGIHADGHAYIAAAVRAGAIAVVHGRDVTEKLPGAAYVRVPDCRIAMSRIAASFYDRPSSGMKTIGVTGTDGKSSTVSFIYQILESLGKPAGLLSTVSFVAGNNLEKNPYRQSTPEAPIIHGILDRMRRSGKEYAVIEATSHGLSRKTGRLLDVEFDAAVITNVTHEHLEFHGSREQYLHDKTNLFRALNARRSAAKGVPAFGVVNADDESFAYIKRETKEHLISYSVLRRDTDLFATDIRPDMAGTTFSLHDGGERTDLRIGMPGAFNVENVLAAAGAVSRITGVSSVRLAPHIEKLTGVRGRMTPVGKDLPFSVIVDYAHTPGAFARLFPMVKEYTPGRIITVFGSGGERDVEKRPVQGRIASDYSGIVILSDEDPRGEDPRGLLEEIAAGCTNLEREKSLFIIPDRRLAIARAFELARPGDTVLLLGKGHETSIIYADGPIPWDEIEVAREILSRRKVDNPGASGL